MQCGISSAVPANSSFPRAALPLPGLPCPGLTSFAPFWGFISFLAGAAGISFFFLWLLIGQALIAGPKIEMGVDRLFSEPYVKLIQGKKVGLITNQTGVTRFHELTSKLLARQQKNVGFELVALFAPEHGLFGDSYAEEKVAISKTRDGIPIYSLYGETRRPTKEMLSGITLLIFDIQDIGTRSYTYATTLFYAMEEAAKAHIPVLVLDRPNPINGVCIDGPMLENEFRSFIGYVNVPYCHGMTIGELARFFKDQYQIKCDVTVVPMRGWKREMSFDDTGLIWVPTSPHVPEATTAYYYPMTGFLGELQFVSIGIWYSLPFKIVGAPWIDGEKLATTLNNFQLPGILFRPIRFRPFAGKLASTCCQGVQIVVFDPIHFLPVTTQYALLCALKELYPEKLQEALASLESRPHTLFKACGTKAIIELLQKHKHPFTQLKELHTQARTNFLAIRKKYLLPDYQ